jgi:hypothetical protein
VKYRKHIRAGLTATLGTVLIALCACDVSTNNSASTLKPDDDATAVTALTAEDRVEIYELIARYNATEDGGDIESWVDTYTTDGTFTGLRQGNSITGHDALRKFAIERLRRPGQISAAHWNSNTTITPTAAGAQAQSYVLIIEKATDGSLRMRSMATKLDELRKENGRWRFKSRINKPWPDDPPAPPAHSMAN